MGDAMGEKRIQKSHHYAEGLSPVEQLAIGIINRALQDYIHALRKEAKRNSTSYEARTVGTSSAALEWWFHSKWASVLMQGADPEELLSKARSVAHI